VTFKNLIRLALEKSIYLSKLRRAEHEKIIDLMKINLYKAGNIIIKKADDGLLPANQKIIVVIEGSIKKSKNINLAAVRSQVYG
jgi:cGMP-dependent protein kinase